MRTLVIAILGGIICLGATCERPLDIRLPAQEPRLLVVSEFTTGAPLDVQVSRTTGVFEEDANNSILNAGVRLYSENQFLEELPLVFPEDLPPFYRSEVSRPIGNRDYTLEVTVPGFETIRATSRIPEAVSLDRAELQSLDIEDIPGENQKRYTFNLQLAFSDPGQIKNQYHLRIYQKFTRFSVLRNDTVVTGTPIRELQFSPGINDNFQISHYRGGVMLDDTAFDGESFILDIPLSIEVNAENELPGKIFAELRSVSEEYYRFNAAVSRQQSSPGFPLAEPITLYSNFEGASGVFAGYAQSLDSIPLISP